MKTLIRVLFLSALGSAFISTSVLADWALQNDLSSVHFISTKKQHISEIHHFKQLTASLKTDGHFSLSIDLGSVETGIEIRNTRMQEHLFKVAMFPTAEINATLSAMVMQLKKGQSMEVTLPASLNLMQTTSALDLTIQVTKTLEGDYVATSVQPVLISAADFGLKEGVETLQKLAGLPSIGLTVPVSFNLVLKAR
ncbi:YceI family protein [Paraglaciecola aquimarina]|uniref:YceI family protein n=1 Tax=Paraglaciecola algarum TaxID=3050085 RepID=A0ABS9D2U8_9ALTE|nr:YceI family protein [Paraglaciecola sp. G1-23]MCF2947248.1 YceI family protein [Paraglaciecola sp. G1-23]